MRNVRVLRLSSTRDACVSCATRPSAPTDGSLTLSSLSQRRKLNSSSKSPQYASEGLVYEERTQPGRARPLTEAEGMRHLLQAAAQRPRRRQPQWGHMPRAEHPRPPQQLQRPAWSQQEKARRPHPPERRPNEPGLLGGTGRARSNDGFAPITRRIQSQTVEQLGGLGSRPSSRFNVNMDSRPPVRDAGAFGSWHLRRKNDPHVERDPIGTKFSYPSKPTTKLDQSEIDRLLGNSPSQDRPQPARPYARLSRGTNVQAKCMHCGAESHASFDCPTKPVLRQKSPPRQQQSQTLSEAAEAWVRKHSSTVDAVQSLSYEKGEKRRYVEGIEKKRSRFQLDETIALETQNRYEQPLHRQRGPERRSRNRVIRDEDEEDERYVDKAERKRQRKEAKMKMRAAKAEPVPVYLPEYISVANLAPLLKVRVEDFVAKLEELGFEDVQYDHVLNAEHAGLVAQEYGFEPIMQTEENDGDLRPAPPLSAEKYAELPPRPPVVTIMGHVDHGKTTILDYIRCTSVAASEFGGITQHIGAFSVSLAHGKKITFLDTPGHAAFETMRARGANVTDIVVLVVAADDSVMPQTVEAIKHAQAAKVPIIVAINKIDKQQADPDAVKLDLGRHGIEVEDFGGEVQAVCVSGKTGQGIPDLEEAISTLSEMLDHRADPNAKVEGWVLEGTTKKSGRVATVLVRNGTLCVGDILVAGTSWTRVRSLRNEAGVAVKQAGPGMPVEVDGWREQPIAGDEVLQAKDEQEAQSVSELRQEKIERQQMAKDMEAINESRRLETERREAEDRSGPGATKKDVLAHEEKREKGPEVIPFIVKGDVSGSVEAVIDSISGIGNAEIATRVLRHGVGCPSEFDVQHAADASGHIVSFNTTIPNHIMAMAEDKGVKILDSNIIYRVVENVKTLLEERLTPNMVQKVTGEAEIAMCFDIGLGGKKKMKVAGSKVRNGVVEKGTKARVLRRDEVVFDGIVSSLKNQKKDVDQMRKDTECGIAFDGWEDFKVGDKIQCYAEEKQPRRL